MTDIAIKEPLQFERQYHIEKPCRRKPPKQPEGRIPRISRLMALAIHLDGLVKSGKVRDQAELARAGHVTRARVTQIMNFLNLAPDIQEEILFLPKTVRGRDPIRERHIRPVSAEFLWEKQREMWLRLKKQQDS